MVYKWTVFLDKDLETAVACCNTDTSATSAYQIQGIGWDVFQSCPGTGRHFRYKIFAKPCLGVHDNCQTNIAYASMQNDKSHWEMRSLIFFKSAKCVIDWEFFILFLWNESSFYIELNNIGSMPVTLMNIGVIAYFVPLVAQITYRFRHKSST